MPRPKVKKTIMTEVPIDTAVKAKMAEAGVALPVPVGVSEDSIEEERKRLDMVVYEAVIDGKAKQYPVTTITPRKGKFYVIRTYESKGRSRIIVSPKDWNESFPFSKGPVLTKYGITEGHTCNITMKLIDVMIDVVSEEVIGVYLIIMTPNFAQIDVDAKKLLQTVTDYDVLKAKEEIITHEALNLKFQLDEAMQRAETYRQALFDRETNIVKLAEDFAAPIIETTLAALAATKDMFDQYYKDRAPFLEKYKWYILTLIIIAAATILYFFGPWAGG